MSGRTPKIVLQPGEVRVRHVKLGLSTDPGAVRVLDQWYAPQPREGVNGDQGFIVGDYERRMQEEGPFTLTFPNAAGPDGKLHRERFAITATPTEYRPGDEWFEVYWEGAEKPLFVGTPTKARMTLSEITLTGFDAWLMLKRTREFQAGFHGHAPRDVWERYTRAWVVQEGEDFSTQQFAWSTTMQPSPDGRWESSQCNSSGEALRLHPAAGQGAYLSALNQVAFGPNSTDRHMTHRLEGRYTRSSFLDGATAFRFGLHGLVGGVDVALCSLIVSGATTKLHCQGYDDVDAHLDTDPPGPFSVAIEVQPRWTYFYLDGKLLGYQPSPVASDNGMADIAASLITGSGDAAAWVDLDHILHRRCAPYLMRGTDKGDYRIPGAPVATGLAGDYFDDVDLNQMAAASRIATILNPTRPSKPRTDPAINFPAGGTPTTWQRPAGPFGGENFSVRWTGAVYLDLDNYDYSFRAISDDRARVWVGKTRFGEQIFDDWTAGGHAPTTLGGTWIKSGNSGDVAPSGTTGPLYGQRSGWYPIVVEYSNSGGNGMVVLQYQRSDHRYMYVAAGNPGLGHLIRNSASVTRYWPLNDAAYSIALEQGPSGLGTPANGTYNTTPAWRAGPFAGEIAPDFNSALSVACGNPPVTANRWTVGAWVSADSLAGFRKIVQKDGVLQLLVLDVANGSRLRAGVGNGAGFGTAAFADAPSAMVVGAWYRVIATYDGTNLRLYVNGVLVGTSTTFTAGGTNGNTLTIGSAFGTAEFWDGAIAHVVLADRVWDAAEIVADFNNGTPVPSGAALSPQGVHKQLVRNESHYDVTRALEEAWAIQGTVEPRQLESGQFPGELVPRVRLGRDTEELLDEQDARDIMSEIDAEAAADALQADAAGIADPDSGTQLTAELFVFDRLKAHAFLIEDYESLSEITDPYLLRQRMASLLALRGAPWEQVAAQPPGFSKYLDRFPLAEDYAEFAWLPGDGVRLAFPSVGVQDTLPRQIMGLKRKFVPGGLAMPEASFRQRPRSFAENLRRLQRGYLQQQRNYQGQVSVVPGGLGGNTTGAQDVNSRVSLPPDPADVINAYLVVQFKSDTSTWTIFVNGASTGITFTSPGPYKVSRFVAMDSGALPRMYAHCVGGTGTAEYALELHVAH